MKIITNSNNDNNNNDSNTSNSSNTSSTNVISPEGKANLRTKTLDFRGFDSSSWYILVCIYIYIYTYS